MKSDNIKKGIQRAPHRSLLRACGLEDEDFKKPFIGIANSFTDIVPGHIHLRDLVEFVKEGIIAAGGVPFEFDTMAICDGISMNHEGMKYSLPSREIIAATVGDGKAFIAETQSFDETARNLIVYDLETKTYVRYMISLEYRKPVLFMYENAGYLYMIHEDGYIYKVKI